MTPDRHISVNRRGLIKAVGAFYNEGGKDVGEMTHIGGRHKVDKRKSDGIQHIWYMKL